MKKQEDHTRCFVNVKEVETIFRACDNYPYTVYKDQDRDGVYYMDASDGDPNIARLNTKFDTDEAAVKHVQDFLDSFDVTGGDDL